MDDKLNILKAVSGRFPAWSRLLQMACSEIEVMVNDGKSPAAKTSSGRPFMFASCKEGF